MSNYVIRRLVLMLPTLFLASVLIFLAMRVMPGDVAAAVLGDSATPASIEQLREELGLNRPLLTQYLSWIGGIFTLDLGTSLLYRGSEVDQLIVAALPTTVTMAVYGIVLTLIFALPLGVLSALKRGTIIDPVLKFVTVSGISIPTFWLGILSLFAFISIFTWSPRFEYVSVFDDPIGNFTTFIVPASIMAFHNVAVIARMLRSQMLEVIRQDYIRTAQAKGLSPRSIAWRHAVPNALLPVVTVAGSQFAILISGLVVMERVFNLPGLGTLMIHGAMGRDYILVQTLFMFIAVLVLVINLAVDLLYLRLDPRVRVSAST